MTTVAQNRWAELITIESATEVVGSNSEVLGGWRWCRTSTCVSDADGGTATAIDIDYTSNTYGSVALPRPSLNRGSLIGFWAGTDASLFHLELGELYRLSVDELFGLSLGDQDAIVSEPFFIGSDYVAEVPLSADELVLGFHDQNQWNNNYGSQTVTITFEGCNPQTHTVYATQCVYFRYAPAGLLGPAPYYEDIDNGTAQGPHRPQIVTVPSGALYVAIQSSSDSVRTEQVPNQFPYLKLERYLFDRAKYQSLQARVMLWKRGRNIEDYYMFVLRNDTLDNIPITYDVTTCYLNGPTIVAIKKDVRSSLVHIMNKIKRSPILPQRTPTI